MAHYGCCSESTDKPREYRLKAQVAVITALSLLAVTHGMSVCHAAVLVPQIRSENGTIQVDQEMGSWIASVYSLTAPIGCLLGGILSEILGRRCAVFAGYIWMLMGWLMIALGENTGVILAGRCTEGISKSITSTAITVLIDETIHPKLRGFIFAQYASMLSMGIFAMMGLATLMTWRTSSLVAFGFSAVSCGSTFLVMESPVWLVRKGRLKDAQNSLHWLWGESRLEKARQVLQNLREFYTSNRKSPRPLIKRLLGWRRIVKPRFLKPFLIIHLTNAYIHMFCGNHLVINYGVDMVSSMSPSQDPYVVNTVFSVIRTLVCIVAGIVMTFLGRRTMMVMSGSASAVAALALAAVLYFDVVNADLLRTLLLGAYVASFSAGYLMVPTTMIGETLPAAIRSYLCGYIYTINDLSGGGVVKLYPWLLRALGLHGIFLMVGVCCAIFVVLGHLFLPETHGKTLEDIEEYFRQDNIMWVTRNKCLTSTSDEIRCLNSKDTSSRL